MRSIQSVAQNLDQFKPDDFGYIIIDECHHGTAGTYRKILGHFKPKFTLGLTATPERADGVDLLELFRNVAHKLDLKTAVEIGELSPIRCIRVKTNVDLSTVGIYALLSKVLKGRTNKVINVLAAVFTILALLLVALLLVSHRWVRIK